MDALRSSVVRTCVLHGLRGKGGAEVRLDRALGHAVRDSTADQGHRGQGVRLRCHGGGRRPDRLLGASRRRGGRGRASAARPRILRVQQCRRDALRVQCPHPHTRDECGAAGPDPEPGIPEFGLRRHERQLRHDRSCHGSRSDQEVRNQDNHHQQLPERVRCRLPWSLVVRHHRQLHPVHQGRGGEDREGGQEDPLDRPRGICIHREGPCHVRASGDCLARPGAGCRGRRRDQGMGGLQGGPGPAFDARAAGRLLSGADVPAAQVRLLGQPEGHGRLYGKDQEAQWKDRLRPSGQQHRQGRSRRLDPERRGLRCKVPGLSRTFIMSIEGGVSGTSLSFSPHSGMSAP